MKEVRETRHPRLPALIHPDWADRMPWLVQGTTTRGPAADAFDLGHFAGASPDSRVRGHWAQLLDGTGMRGGVLAQQVHEADVLLHTRVPEGLELSDACDGHATDRPGLLLAVTVADCVPVFMVALRERAVAVVHAGWRGTAAGVLEAGLSVLTDQLGASASDAWLHLGPSICGACYEVGPEVFTALHEPVPSGPQPVDLRGVLARRAVAAGVPPAQLSISAHCTRCTASELFSHRGGDGERQVGFVGIRA